MKNWFVIVTIFGFLATEFAVFGTQSKTKSKRNYLRNDVVYVGYSLPSAAPKLAKITEALTF